MVGPVIHHSPGLGGAEGNLWVFEWLEQDAGRDLVGSRAQKPTQQSGALESRPDGFAPVCTLW